MRTMVGRTFLLFWFVSGTAQAGWWTCALAVAGWLPQDKAPLIPYRMPSGYRMAGIPKKFRLALPVDHPAETVSRNLGLGINDYTYFSVSDWERLNREITEGPLKPREQVFPDLKSGWWIDAQKRLALQQAKETEYVRIPTWFLENHVQGKTGAQELLAIQKLHLMLRLSAVPYGKQIGRWDEVKDLELGPRTERALKWYFASGGRLQFTALAQTMGGVQVDYEFAMQQLQEVQESDSFRMGSYGVHQDLILINVVSGHAAENYSVWKRAVEETITHEISHAAIARMGFAPVPVMEKVIEIAEPHPWRPGLATRDQLMAVIPRMMEDYFIETLLTDRASFFGTEQILSDFATCHRLVLGSEVDPRILNEARALIVKVRTVDTYESTISHSMELRKMWEERVNTKLRSLTDAKLFRILFLIQVQSQLTGVIDEFISHILGGGKFNPALYPQYPNFVFQYAEEVFSEREKYFLNPGAFVGLLRALGELE